MNGWGQGENSSTLRVETTWGTLVVAARDGALTACHLPRVDLAPVAVLDWISASRELADPADDAVLDQAERMIIGLLSGRPEPVPPVRFPPAPAFTTRVWTAMQNIGFGESATYGDLAAAAGSPRAARAVGQACAGNVLPLFVPCHRVVGHGRALGGFSSGLAWKLALRLRERGGV